MIFEDLNVVPGGRDERRRRRRFEQAEERRRWRFPEMVGKLSQSGTGKARRERVEVFRSPV